MNLFDVPKWDDKWKWKDDKTPLPPPCRHRMAPVPMHDGLVFYASSHHRIRELDEIQPELGCYLDSVWEPDCIAFTVHWRDFGVPSLEIYVFTELLRWLREYAIEEYIIEIGCVGGHGRTGTMLACLDVADGKTSPTQAVDHIREVYCHKAVETEQQEWLVKRVHAEIHQLECEEMPKAQPLYVQQNPPTNAEDWGAYSNTKEGQHKGQTAKVKTDASGVEYCSACLVDIPDATTQKCTWCAATLKGRK